MAVNHPSPIFMSIRGSLPVLLGVWFLKRPGFIVLTGSTPTLGDRTSFPRTPPPSVRLVPVTLTGLKEPPLDSKLDLSVNSQNFTGDGEGELNH